MTVFISELIIIGIEQYDFQNNMWHGKSKDVRKHGRKKGEQQKRQKFGHGFLPLFLKLVVTAPLLIRSPSIDSSKEVRKKQ